MPIFDYQCASCGKTYDIFHKVREVIDDIECPHCGSHEYRKLMSVPAAFSETSGSSASSDSSAAGGCCCGGACGIN